MRDVLYREVVSHPVPTIGSLLVPGRQGVRASTVDSCQRRCRSQGMEKDGTNDCRRQAEEDTFAKG